MSKWHIAHPRVEAPDERIAICGSDGPAYGIWERWQDEFKPTCCERCSELHLEALRAAIDRVKRGDKNWLPPTHLRERLDMAIERLAQDTKEKEKEHE